MQMEDIIRLERVSRRFESCHQHHFMNTRLQHEKDYVEFLERRVKSANFKKNVSPEEFDKTEKKLKKAKLVLRMLEK